MLHLGIEVVVQALQVLVSFIALWAFSEHQNFEQPKLIDTYHVSRIREALPFPINFFSIIVGRNFQHFYYFSTKTFGQVVVNCLHSVNFGYIFKISYASDMWNPAENVGAIIIK